MATKEQRNVSSLGTQFSHSSRRRITEHCRLIDGATRTSVCAIRVWTMRVTCLESARASVPSDRGDSRQAIRVALRPSNQRCAVQAELRFDGLSRDNGVQAQVGREYHDSSGVT